MKEMEGEREGEREIQFIDANILILSGAFESAQMLIYLVFFKRLPNCEKSFSPV